MAPMLNSVKFQSGNALYPWTDTNSGPKIFSQEKVQKWLNSPSENWSVRPNLSTKVIGSSGDSLYDVAGSFCSNFGGSAPVQKVAMVTASAEFSHETTNKTMTSFARVTRKKIVVSIKMPDALNTEHDRIFIRNLLLPGVKKDVDAISNHAEAKDFVKRYGPVIFSTADFGGAMSGTTNSSMNKSTTATSMKLALATEMQMANLSANASTGLGQTTSSTDNSFTYDLRAWGGNVTLLSKGETTNWLESLKLEKSKYPISVVDQSFASIEVLAEWKSEQDSFLAAAVTSIISEIDMELSEMVVKNSIKKEIKKSMLKMNNSKMEWLLERRNTEQAGKDNMFFTGRLYVNGVDACNLHIKLLKDFDKEINRVDQAGTALKSWAERTRRREITSQKDRYWGVLGHDSTNWNRIFDVMETHWNLIIDSHSFKGKKK
jgi:hypothetical protein